MQLIWKAGNFIEASTVYTECLASTPSTRDPLVSNAAGNDNAQTSSAADKPSTSGSEAASTAGEKTVEQQAADQVALTKRTPSQLAADQLAVTQRTPSQLAMIQRTASQRTARSVVPPVPVPLPPALKSDYAPESKVYKHCTSTIEIPRLPGQGPRSNIYKKCVVDARPEVFESTLFNKCRNLISKLFLKCHPHGLKDAQSAHTKCHESLRKIKAEEVHKKCHGDKQRKLSDVIYEKCHEDNPAGGAAMFGKCVHLGHQHDPNEQQHEQHPPHGDDAHNDAHGDLLGDEHGGHDDPPPTFNQRKKDKLLLSGHKADGKKKKRICKKSILGTLKCFFLNFHRHVPLVGKLIDLGKTAYHALMGHSDYQKNEKDEYEPKVLAKINAPLKKHDELPEYQQIEDDHQYEPEPEPEHEKKATAVAR